MWGSYSFKSCQGCSCCAPTHTPWKSQKFCEKILWCNSLNRQTPRPPFVPLRCFFAQFTLDYQCFVHLCTLVSPMLMVFTLVVAIVKRNHCYHHATYLPCFYTSAILANHSQLALTYARAHTHTRYPLYVTPHLFVLHALCCQYPEHVAQLSLFVSLCFQ